MCVIVMCVIVMHVIVMCVIVMCVQHQPKPFCSVFSYVSCHQLPGHVTCDIETNIYDQRIASVAGEPCCEKTILVPNILSSVCHHHNHHDQDHH